MLHRAITANADEPRNWLIDVSGCVQRAGGGPGLRHHPHGARVVNPATSVRQRRGEPAVRRRAERTLPALRHHPGARGGRRQLYDQHRHRAKAAPAGATPALIVSL